MEVSNELKVERMRVRVRGKRVGEEMGMRGEEVWKMEEWERGGVVGVYDGVYEEIDRVDKGGNGREDRGKGGNGEGRGGRGGDWLDWEVEEFEESG